MDITNKETLDRHQRRIIIKEIYFFAGLFKTNSIRIIKQNFSAKWILRIGQKKEAAQMPPHA